MGMKFSVQVPKSKNGVAGWELRVALLKPIFRASVRRWAGKHFGRTNKKHGKLVEKWQDLPDIICDRGYSVASKNSLLIVSVPATIPQKMITFSCVGVAIKAKDEWAPTGFIGNNSVPLLIAWHPIPSEEMKK